MSKRWLIIFAVIVAASGGYFFAAEMRDRQARAARVEAEILKSVSKEELAQILASQASVDRESVHTITATPESQRAFLDGLKQHLALAAEARREGLADTSAFRINLEYKKNSMLADIYGARLSEGLPKPYSVAEQEIKDVWLDVQNEENFKRDIETLRNIQRSAAIETGRVVPPTILQGEGLEKARTNWARIKVLSDKAKADPAFIANSNLEVRFRVLEAGLLSNEYLRKHWVDEIKATEAEVRQFLAEKPEYDVSRKLETAMAVLNRATAGEDFAALAKQFSEHRPTKPDGGLFADLASDQVWPELERAALSLNPGEVSPKLVVTEMGWHVLKLEKRNISRDDAGKITGSFSIRHILFQNKFEDPNSSDPNIPPPFLKPTEIAIASIEARKREAFLKMIVGRNEIVLPDSIEI